MYRNSILMILVIAGLWYSAANGQHVKTYGNYFFRHRAYRQSLFNPGDIMQKYKGVQDRARLYLNLYTEAGYRLGNVYVQADVLAGAEGMETWDSHLLFPQIFIDIDFENLVVTAGRAIHHWGTGYAFNPTDVIAPEKDVGDPENSQRTAIGIDMIKAEYFGGSWSAGVCAMGSVTRDNGLHVKSPRVALRIYKTVWDADFSCIALISADEKPVWGINCATVFGDRLEVHGELAWYVGSRRTFHRALFDDFSLYETAPFTRRAGSKDKCADWVAGFQYTISKNALVIGEWFHHDGMSGNQWDRFTDYGVWLREQLSGPYSEPAEYNLLWCAKAYSQSGAMQDYIMTTFHYTLENRLHARATMFVNTSDASFIAMPYLSYTVKNTLSLYVRGFIFKGADNTEFGEFFQSFYVEGGIRVL